MASLRPRLTQRPTPSLSHPRQVSGHTLKHLLAGAAGWQVARMLRE